jgi:hypothetical protein
MSELTPRTDDLGDFAVEIADQVESFVVAVREIAAAEDPDYAISLLLLEVSQLLLAGGRLGAISDVVPDERFEPDTGYDPDVDGLRHSLANLLLLHGLQHYRAGRPVEALWWWQFSYLSNWGSTASSALRALHSVVSHVRLDSDGDETIQVEDRLLAQAAVEAVDTT